jgi:hypothetical protein
VKEFVLQDKISLIRVKGSGIFWEWHQFDNNNKKPKASVKLIIVKNIILIIIITKFCYIRFDL